MDGEKKKRLLRVPEAASRLAVKESTVRKLIFERRIPIVKIGRVVAIPEDCIEKMIQDGYQAALREGKALER